MDPYERVAREAARLRYDEPDLYREYIHAKREASKRLGLDVLPDNKSIFMYYQEIADMREGREERLVLLKKMRLEALKWMKLFEDFSPKVLGSVKRGDVTSKSDIDIHVLVDDDYDDFLDFLGRKRIYYDYRVNTVRNNKEVKDYHHVMIDGEFRCEITIYLREEYVPQTCSIFGDKIKGITVKQLEKILNEE